MRHFGESPLLSDLYELPLLQAHHLGGLRLAPVPSLASGRSYAAQQLAALPPEFRALEAAPPDPLAPDGALLALAELAGQWQLSGAAGYHGFP